MHWLAIASIRPLSDQPSSSYLQKWFDLRLGVGNVVRRDIDAGHLEPRHHLRELVEQMGLAAADIEDPHAGHKIIWRRDFLRDNALPAIVVVVAIV